MLTKFKQLQILLTATILVAGMSLTEIANAAAVRMTQGDLVIVEVMANPNVISDADGEWIELFNNGAGTIDLQGLTLMDAASASDVLDFGGTFNLAPGEIATLASSSTPGFTPDAVFSNVTLNNPGDELTILSGLTEITRFEYDVAALLAGSSINVNPGLATYANANTLYDGDNFGTPGASNPFISGSSVEVLSPVPLPAALPLFLTALAG